MQLNEEKVMRKSILLLCFSVLLLSLVGCSYRIGDFTVISTKNVELGAKYEKIGMGEGTDEVVVLLVPLGQPNMKEAIDRLLEEKNGELLTNAVVYSYSYQFLFGVIGVSVKGDVWKKAGVAALDNSKEYYQLTQKANDLFLVSCDNPTKSVKVEFR
jgi:hypothetical protein